MEFDNKLVVPTDQRFLNREPATLELLAAVGVEEKWAAYIRVLDRQGPLALLHYINTYTSTDDRTINEAPLKEIGHIRGTVVDTNSGKVVCRSFPYTPEAVSNDPQRIRALLPEELFNSLLVQLSPNIPLEPNTLSRMSLYNVCEGTVLRLFWAAGQWHLSTHRKIDANNSYWAGPTFGAMFEELCQFSYEELNKDLCYVFLMSHDGNRLVYKIPTPQLMLIAVYKQSEQRFLAGSEYGTPLAGCVYPEQIAGVASVAELQKTVEECAAFNRAGVLAIADPCNPRPVKIINSAYHSLRNARGNDPNLRSRYLQLRGSPEGGLIVQWFTEPRYQEIFDAAETEIDELTIRLHDMYINRYVRKDFSQLPKEEFVTLQRCHGWHVEDRSHNIVTATKVRELLNTTPNHYLLIMLNRQRREQCGVAPPQTTRPPAEFLENGDDAFI